MTATLTSADAPAVQREAVAGSPFMRKAAIVAELSGQSLLLPDLVASALGANARIKYALSWLQSADAAAASLDGEKPADLDTERALAGLGDDPVYAPPEIGARTAAGATVKDSGTVVARMREDVGRMRAAVDAAAAAGAVDEAFALRMRERECAVARDATLADDVLPAGFVSRLARPARSGVDSLHALVMDLHRALNAITARLAETEVDGARAFRLADADTARVAAFMRGLNRTAPLRFEHPGLATTAMRQGERLVIQNDIGETEAHVLIVHVEPRAVAVTYSDVHWRRLEFFRERLPHFSWEVSSTRSRLNDTAFHLATGRYAAADERALDGALERIGASTVFLIDWNKARKSLRRLVPRGDALALLGWAADHEVGHRAYLELGGDALVSELLATAAKLTGEPYTSLQSALGADGAAAFLREVLRITSEELRSSRSPMMIRDLLAAELLARVASVADRIVDIALDHAAVMLDLGNLVRDGLLDGARCERAAARAQLWETKADLQVARIHALAGTGRQRVWREIASGADDAADALEESAFRLQFLPPRVPAAIRARLCDLADEAVLAMRDYIRLLSALRSVHRGAARPEVKRFLDHMQALRDDEHATDTRLRELFASLMHDTGDAKLLGVATAIGDDLEDVGDVLLRAGRLVSDLALGEWFAT